MSTALKVRVNRIQDDTKSYSVLCTSSIKDRSSIQSDRTVSIFMPSWTDLFKIASHTWKILQISRHFCWNHSGLDSGLALNIWSLFFRQAEPSGNTISYTRIVSALLKVVDSNCDAPFWWSLYFRPRLCMLFAKVEGIVWGCLKAVQKTLGSHRDW